MLKLKVVEQTENLLIFNCSLSAHSDRNEISRCQQSIAVSKEQSGRKKIVKLLQAALEFSYCEQVKMIRVVNLQRRI